MSARAFPGATCGRDLVPGEPARVLRLADQLAAMGQGLRVVVAMLRGAAGVPGWYGTAAPLFQTMVSLDPEPYAAACAAMGTAGDAVLRHADVLARAQRRAQEGLDVDRVAEARTIAWRDRQPVDGGPDPGAASRAVAVQLVTDARRMVRSSGAEAAATLRRVASLAPDEPNELQRAVEWGFDQGREVATGTVEGLSGFVLLAARFDPRRLVVDPAGVLLDTRDLGQGAWQVVRHPGDTARAVVTEFREAPARATGRLVPDLLVGAVTGGAGAVATRGASLGARARLLVSADVGMRTAATTIRAVRQSGRTGLRLSDLSEYHSTPSRHGTVDHLEPLDHAVAQVLARDARWAAPALTDRMKRLAVARRFELLKLETSLKESSSLNRKIATKLAEGRSIADLAPSMNDTIRYATSFEDDVYAARTLETVAAMHEEGFALVVAKAKWSGPGYLGTNLTFLDGQTGRLFELQTHNPASWQANLATHGAYETVRDVGASPAVRKEAADALDRAYRTVPVPPGARDLQDLLDALRVDAPQRSVATPWGRHDPAVRTGMWTGAGSGTVTGALVPGGEPATRPSR